MVEAFMQVLREVVMEARLVDGLGFGPGCGVE